MAQSLLLSLVCVSCVVAGQVETNETACPPARGIALQVLGSGGPIADDGRASSAYLLWRDGHARVLVDAGGGSFLRFGEAGAKFEDLQLIALSHFHTDHSADLPALLKSGNFSRRKDALKISGPSGAKRFPGLEDFLQSMLDTYSGAYRYLAGYLDGTDDLVMLEQVELSSDNTETQTVLNEDGLMVSALPVPHGIVPSMAYRVEANGISIVFGSDQNGGSSEFTTFARGADVLVAHLAIPETAGRAARSLHATPSVIGEMAAEASAKKLLLSHFMARSLRTMDENLALIRKEFEGVTILASDLACLIP